MQLNIMFSFNDIRDEITLERTWYALPCQCHSWSISNGHANL